MEKINEDTINLVEEECEKVQSKDVSENKSKNNYSVKKNLTKKLVGTGIFAALAFAVSFLEFPIFPATPFLKLDFSLVFVTLSGFIFGPIYGVATCVVKELIRFSMSSTGGIGELANVIVSVCFILVPTIVYYYKKGIPTVIITLSIGCVLTTCVSLLTNRYIMFPFYMGDTAEKVFNSVWYFILLFNLIKAVIISILTFFLYKRLSNIIKKI